MWNHNVDRQCLHVSKIQNRDIDFHQILHNSGMCAVVYMAVYVHNKISCIFRISVSADSKFYSSFKQQDVLCLNSEGNMVYM